MLYWGFGFVLLAIAAFLVGIEGAPGLGPVTNIALVAAMALLAGGIMTSGHRDHFHRRTHR